MILFSSRVGALLRYQEVNWGELGGGGGGGDALSLRVPQNIALSKPETIACSLARRGWRVRPGYVRSLR